MKSFIFLSTILFLMGCGGGYNPDKAKLNEVQDLGGTGYYEVNSHQWLMAESLKSVSSGANFELNFTLSEGGQLTLHAFSDTALTRGVDIKFVRTSGALQVLVTAQGSEQDWSSYFAGIDATGNISLTMDIHNNEHPAHIMIWQGGKKSSLDHTNTLYNSAEDSVDLGYAGSPGNGPQRSWGVSFDQAEISSLILSSPQETHE